jgi:hypothetical protein
MDKTRQSLTRNANRARNIKDNVKKYHMLVPAEARCLTPTYSTRRIYIDRDELPKTATTTRSND